MAINDDENDANSFRKYLHDVLGKYNVPPRKSSFFTQIFGGNTAQALFLPIPDLAKALLMENELNSQPVLPVPEALDLALNRFGSLSSGYTTFMSLLGPGKWANAIIRHPHYLRPLGNPDGIAHFVLMADNVDGQGGCVLFDPEDKSSNQNMYYACESGYGLLASCFEEWIRKLTQQWIQDKNGYDKVYDISLCEFDR